MSIAVLTQVYDEMRRLAIAGSVVAGGDFRLKKLVAPLEQAGAKSPVFAKVAQGVKTLVESDEKTSADALLELGTLVNAILYTQGETGLAGDLKPLETTNLGPQTTQASARVLKPLLEALTGTGSGRLEIIRDSHQRGAFRDLRLVKPALQGLDDPYPEISALIADKILPLYGKAILPELQTKFDLKGKAGHLRRLKLMHQLDSEGTRETVKKALEEGSKEMKVAAIECLGDSPEDLSFLLEQVKAKAKDVRQAALTSLSKLNAAEAVDAMQKAIAGSDLDLAVAPVLNNKNPKLVSFIIAESQQQLEKLFKTKDKKEAGQAAERMIQLLNCFSNRDDKLSEAFLLKMFEQRDKIAGVKAEPSGTDINRLVAVLMSGSSTAAKQKLVAAHASLSPDELGTAFQAALRSKKPAELYDLFSPYMTAKVDEKKKERDPAWAKREAICDTITGYDRRYVAEDDDDEDGESSKEKITWDNRWLDLAVKIKHLPLVHHLARPNHAATNQYLTEAFAANLKSSKDLYDCHVILETMVRVQHPEATDAFVASLKKHAMGKYNWGIYWIGRLIPDLPKSALPVLEELLPTLEEKAIDQLMDYVTALKNKP